MAAPGRVARLGKRRAPSSSHHRSRRSAHQPRDEADGTRVHDAAIGRLPAPHDRRATFAHPLGTGLTSVRNITECPIKLPLPAVCRISSCPSVRAPAPPSIGRRTPSTPCRPGLSPPYPLSRTVVYLGPALPQAVPADPQALPEPAPLGRHRSRRGHRGSRLGHRLGHDRRRRLLQARSGPCTILPGHQSTPVAHSSRDHP